MSWWRKKLTPAPIPAIAVTTIPLDFYAGRTPEVVFPISKTKMTSAGGRTQLTKTEKRAVDAINQVGAGSANHPVTMLSRKKTFSLVLAGIFGLGLLGGTLYYLFFGKTSVRPVPTVIAPPAPAPVTEPIAPTNTAVVIPPAPEPVAPPAPVFTVLPLGLGDTADSDSDGLTDLAEDLFKTDPNLADTDQDSYTDAHEIFNLYNPIGKEPQKIIDSGLVNNYPNSVFGYQLYYPVSWAVGNVDPEFKTVLFSAFTGEYIRVQIVDRQPDESFASWLARVIPSETAADYLPFTGASKQTGWRRSDYLVYVWLGDNQAVLASYQLPPGVTVLNYRMAIKMLGQSFRFGVASPLTPPQIIESPTGATSTSGL